MWQYLNYVCEKFFHVELREEQPTLPFFPDVLLLSLHFQNKILLFCRDLCHGEKSCYMAISKLCFVEKFCHVELREEQPTLPLFS